MIKVSPGQIKKIHVLKNKIGLNDENYRTLLSNFNVSTSKDLNFRLAGEFIKILEKQAENTGYKKPKTKPKKFDNLKNRSGMASPKQLRMIEAIWQEVSFTDYALRAKALRSFLFRIADVSDLRFLDSQGASKVINALSKMQKNKSKREEKLCQA